MSALEKVREFLTNPLGEQTFVVTSAALCHKPAQVSARKLCSHDQETIATRALQTFATRLLAINGVDGVALLASQTLYAPTTLCMEVLVPFGSPQEKDGSILRAVTDADADLARQVKGIFPTSLRFVNSAESQLAALEQRLRARWSSEDNLHALAFVRFRRP